MSDFVLPFAVDQDDPRVITIRMTVDFAPFEQWFLLRGDAHHDNIHSDHDLEQRHLKEAAERKAGILDFGDLSCAMGGRYDKRADLNQLRPELRSADYFTALINYNAAFYEPYAPLFLLMAPGNHETSVLQRNQIDIVSMIAKRLSEKGSPVKVGTYSGWVRFMITHHQSHQQSFRLRYTHGHGGGGPVTRDVIQVARQLMYIENADIIVSSHTHDSWSLHQPREYMDANGNLKRRNVTCLKLGTYKDEFSCGIGWAVEKGLPPKPLGAYWLRLFYRAREIHFEVIRAD